jgi:hypothetical protein
MSTKDLPPSPTLEPTAQDDTGPLPPALPEISQDLPAPTFDEEPPETIELRRPLPEDDDATEVEPPAPLEPSPLGALGGDLSATMAANDEDEGEETLLAGTAEAAAMRAQALLRSLPAPPHSTANLPLKTKEEVEAARPRPLTDEPARPRVEPPAPSDPGEILEPAPIGLRALLMLSAAWNIVSAVLWCLSLFGIPLGVFCLILAFFEARLALQAGDIGQQATAERAITISYWEMGALVYALGPITFSFGVVIQIYARKLKRAY